MSRKHSRDPLEKSTCKLLPTAGKEPKPPASSHMRKTPYEEPPWLLQPQSNLQMMAAPAKSLTATS